MQPVTIRQDEALALALMLALVPVENPRPQNKERQYLHTSVSPVPPEDLG